MLKPRIHIAVQAIRELAKSLEPRLRKWASGSPGSETPLTFLSQLRSQVHAQAQPLLHRAYPRDRLRWDTPDFPASREGLVPNVFSSRPEAGLNKPTWILSGLEDVANPLRAPERFFLGLSFWEFGKPKLSVVHQRHGDGLWITESGFGCRYNGHRLRIRRKPAALLRHSLIIGLSSPTQQVAQLLGVWAQLQNLLPPYTLELRRAGCPIEEFSRLSIGESDAVLYKPSTAISGGLYQFWLEELGGRSIPVKFHASTEEETPKLGGALELLELFEPKLPRHPQ